MPFSPALALVVICMTRVTSILPIAAGGAIAGMGTTAGVLLALGVSKGVAVNFSLASGLMPTGAALAAAAVAPAIPASVREDDYQSRTRLPCPS